MNVFVLCTGRTGSKTFMKACQHINNFTSAHESRCQFLGEERVNYPDNHIEVDNRLSWFLGRLDKKYGDNAFYVHLTRERDKVAQSFDQRWGHFSSIIKSYTWGILKTRDQDIKYCYDYIDTVNENIDFFLKDKEKKINFQLENGRENFEKFWNLVGAEGDLEAALAEWKIVHNPTKKKPLGLSKLNKIYIDLKYSIKKLWQ